MAALLSTTTSWYCPNCKKEDVTADARPHVRYHTCPKLRMLSAPMVRKGTSAKVTIRERDDYVNGERVQLDPERKRPVMSIVTTRADGSNDTIVFAPSARGRAHRLLGKPRRGRIA